MIKEKKIAIVGAYKPMACGVSTNIYEISKRLSKHNDVSVIFTYSKQKKYFVDNNVKIFQEPLFYPYRYTVIQTIAQKTKRALLLRKKIDLYHVNSVLDACVGFIDKDRPLVITMHGYASLELVSWEKIKLNSIQFKLIRFLEKRAVKRADAIIAVGKTLKNWIIDELGVNPGKIFYIPNGVDTTKISTLCNNTAKESEILKRRIGLENKRIILFVKAFTNPNGILTLIEALPSIIKKHKNAHLVAIGGGPLKDRVISLSKKLKVSSNLTLIDNIPNECVPVYFNFSECFAAPFNPLFISGREIAGVGDTLGIAHLEAMSASLPVVATAIGNLKKLEAEINNSLIYVPPNDPKSLADAILHLLDHPEEAREMGRKARKLVLEKYSWDKVVEQVSKVYEYALEKHEK